MYIYDIRNSFLGYSSNPYDSFLKIQHLIGYIHVQQDFAKRLPRRAQSHEFAFYFAMGLLLYFPLNIKFSSTQVTSLLVLSLHYRHTLIVVCVLYEYEGRYLFGKSIEAHIIRVYNNSHILVHIQYVSFVTVPAGINDLILCNRSSIYSALVIPLHTSNTYGATRTMSIS